MRWHSGRFAPIAAVLNYPAAFRKLACSSELITAWLRLLAMVTPLRRAADRYFRRTNEDDTLSTTLWFALPNQLGSMIQSFASETLDVVDEFVRSGAGGIDVASGDCFADVGVEIGGQRQIGRLLVVLVPETP